MKARIKETGEIMNIADYAKVKFDACDSYGDPIEKSFEDVEILQEKTSDDGIDWEQRRYEIARELMAQYANLESTWGSLAQLSVKGADALISELKKRNAKTRR